MKEDFKALFVLHGTTYNSFFWMEPYRSTKRRCSREGRAYLQIRYQLSSKISFITKEMAPKQLICNPDTSKHGQIDPKNQRALAKSRLLKSLTYNASLLLSTILVSKNVPISAATRLSHLLFLVILQLE